MDIQQLEIVSARADDPGCVTLAIHHEDHTLGNALRYIVMKNPDVDFCAYTIPHPSEPKIHFRIQTNGSITALEAFDRGLDDLANVFQHIDDSMHKAKEAGSFELVESAEWE